MRVAPASRLFSTSSLTTDAGRSTTSPAAILLTTASGRRWTVFCALTEPSPAQSRGQALTLTSPHPTRGPHSCLRGKTSLARYAGKPKLGPERRVWQSRLEPELPAELVEGRQRLDRRHPLGVEGGQRREDRVRRRRRGCVLRGCLARRGDRHAAEQRELPRVGGRCGSGRALLELPQEDHRARDDLRR